MPENGYTLQDVDCFVPYSVAHVLQQVNNRSLSHPTDPPYTQERLYKDMLNMVPTLALFHPSQSTLGLVFRTKQPLLTPAECDKVNTIVTEHHDNNCDGIWGSVRYRTCTVLLAKPSRNIYLIPYISQLM